MEEGNNCTNDNKIINDETDDNKTNFQKHQLLLKSVLEKLMLDVNDNKRLVKNIKELPKKYFEDVRKSDQTTQQQEQQQQTKEVKKRNKVKHLRLSKSETINTFTNDIKTNDKKVCQHICKPKKMIHFTTRIVPNKFEDCKNNLQQQQQPTELFNPNFNFHKPFCNASIKTNLIESIKRRVFAEYKDNQQSEDDSDSNDWDDDDVPSKFPKETRNAMVTLLNNKSRSQMCKVCEGTKTRKKFNCNNVQTQTTPNRSRINFVEETSSYQNNGACTKNLLCTLGYHLGNCVIESNTSSMICSSTCSKVSLVAEDYLWPGKAKRIDDRNLSEFAPANELTDENLIETLPLHTISQRKIKNDEQELVYRLQQLNNNREIPVKMNGLNGHTNGDLNGCGDIITQNQQKGCWTIGLINSKFRYLTAETFGFKINANGTSLKKKQIWTLEPDMSNTSESMIYLRSHLDKYLAVDSFGNVTCEGEEKDPGSKFQISVAEDGTGRWAFRNVVRGYFLGSSSDKLTCTAKVPGEAEFWHVHLAARPQVNLRSVGRKRFAHLSENLDEIHVDANIPWGEDTLFTLEFRPDESGKYAIHTCNNKYLSCGGKLVDTCSKDCLFTAEYHSGQLALRDHTSAYLSPIGSKAVLKSRSQSVTKDELFSLEDSLPQASFVAALNARYVSVKQGVDVTANQDEISDHETFQLEFDWSTKRWYIRTMQDRYWTLETGGGIQAAGDKRSSNALFDLVWQGDGSVAFRANNGRYIITKRSGHLYATSDNIDDNCKYFFYLVNRPILVLKCEQGFVGYKSASNPKLECNKATYETIQVERAEKGVVYFKGLGGKYWHADSESVMVDSDVPESFYLELREPTRLCIKSANGNYLTANKNGVFHLGDTTIDNATQWEY